MRINSMEGQDNNYNQITLYGVQYSVLYAWTSFLSAVSQDSRLDEFFVPFLNGCIVSATNL